MILTMELKIGQVTAVKLTVASLQLVVSSTTKTLPHQLCAVHASQGQLILILSVKTLIMEPQIQLGMDVLITVIFLTIVA